MTAAGDISWMLEAAANNGGSGKSEKIDSPLETSSALCKLFYVSGGRMQYCVILDVEEVPAATAAGMVLQRRGYKPVSAQVIPSNCPIQPEATNCEACPVVAKPSAPIIEWLGARTLVS